MRERPILFSGPMVRAILAGTKTVTRRVVGLDTLRPSTTPGYDWTWRGEAPVRSIAQQQRRPKNCWQDLRAAEFLKLCPYGVPGDVLYVRETWRADDFNPADTIYRADIPDDVLADAGDLVTWRPSIFLPRVRSRLSLRVVSVRAERLHDIDDADALREGVATGLPGNGCGRAEFSVLWERINEKRAPWASNPWVWRVEFSR